MVRILLPLAIIAAIILGPLLSGAPSVVGGIEKANSLTGNDYIGDTIKCWQAGNYSIAGDCEPEGGMKGKLIFAATLASAVAAVFGLLGLLPIVGRLTSIVTMLAGIVVTGSIAWFAVQIMGGGEDQLEWGTYLAGGGGLLTLISGLSGMRGNH